MGHCSHRLGTIDLNIVLLVLFGRTPILFHLLPLSSSLLNLLSFSSVKNKHEDIVTYVQTSFILPAAQTTILAFHCWKIRAHNFSFTTSGQLTRKLKSNPNFQIHNHMTLKSPDEIQGLNYLCWRVSTMVQFSLNNLHFVPNKRFRHSIIQQK